MPGWARREERFLQHDYRGLPVYYTVEGDGAPVLLLHGWGCSGATLRVVQNALCAAGRRVYAPDLPGFGRSPAPDTPWGIGDYAQCVADFMRSLGIERADVVAHSFGGRIAILLSARHGLGARLAITGGAGIRPRRTLRYYLRVYSYKLGKRLANCRWVSVLLARLGIDLQAQARRAGSSDYRALSGVMRAVFVRVINEDLRAHLSAVRSPVLLLWGENDTETPLWMGELMERTIPDAGLVVLKGGSHYAFLEQPDYFNRVLLTFLGGER